MKKEQFKEMNFKMSYEEYLNCNCEDCDDKTCIHRNCYRRLPQIDGGLGLCPKLRNE